ncbi:MAG: D-alanine--D-alanine ligase [Sedimentisphaerales bacterium]
MRSHPSPNPGSSSSSDRLKVAVLMGGISREREVSIQSGKCVADALKKAGANVITSDIKPDALGILDDETIDVFFIALHGTFGEDGQLQEILESKGLIYTGSGPLASRLAFDKWESKKRFTAAGVTMPDSILFEPGKKTAAVEEQIRQLGSKYVVKPLREGSTIGISIADDPKSAVEAAKKCAAEFGDCMIEEFVPGTEVTVGILGKQALPILEIRPPAGFYDYHAKYIGDKTEYLFDSLNNPALVDKIQESAITCFNSLGCRGAARVDFIIGGENIPHVLEINTIPGMTSHSLLPKAAAKMGLSMGRLCLKIVELALADSAIAHKTGRRK